jgi:NADH-quinone oxidoreductase subunit L
VWLVPLLPLLGALLNGLFGRHINKRWVGWIGAGSVGLAFVVSLNVLFDLLAHPSGTPPFIQPLFDWMLGAQVAFQVDPLSAVMILVVSGVGFLIHVYSIGYMGHDPDYSRYFSWLNLFTFSMLLLVLADNYLLLLVGWELVGLCSYLLIGFWFEKHSAAVAAKKAFIVNRIGDWGFLIGLFLIFATFGSFNYADVFTHATTKLIPGGTLATAITLLLFVGATGKSAQIPLYVWLPDAMEGPTPVSALIHAATMVTAGVYMVVRSHILYALAPVSLEIVAVVGAATALFAVTMALVNNDIKRVLAYSTISQLGYMFLAAGVGAYGAAIFHLMGHAFMKALLFLAAGSVMHALGGEETDMRVMGGLYSKLKTTAVTFMIGALAMSGIPPLVGFFSKDLILSETFKNGHTVLYIIGLVTAILTAFYMMRAGLLTFFGRPRVRPEVAPHVHESSPVMLWPLRGLATLSVLGGIAWVSVADFSPFEHFLSPVFADLSVKSAEAAGPILSEWTLIAISLVAALLGIGIAIYMYLQRPGVAESLAQRLRPLYLLLSNKYWIDEFYALLFVRPGIVLARFLATIFDRSLLDGLVNGVGALMDRSGALLIRIESGYVRQYAALLLFGVLAILIYLFFR